MILLVMTIVILIMIIVITIIIIIIMIMIMLILMINTTMIMLIIMISIVTVMITVTVAVTSILRGPPHARDVPYRPFAPGFPPCPIPSGGASTFKCSESSNVTETYARNTRKTLQAAAKPQRPPPEAETPSGGDGAGAGAGAEASPEADITFVCIGGGFIGANIQISKSEREPSGFVGEQAIEF